MYTDLYGGIAGDNQQGESFDPNTVADAEDQPDILPPSGGDQPSPDGVTPTPPTTPSAASGGSSDWAVGNSYAIGDTCHFEGQSYQCRQAHTVQAPNWTPPNTLALWLPVGTTEWKQGTTYNTDDTCSYDSQNYSCRQAHTAHAANWTPPNTPNLWRPEQ